MHRPQALTTARPAGVAPTRAQEATPHGTQGPQPCVRLRPWVALRPRILALACAALLAASLPLAAATPDTASVASLPARAWAVDCAKNEVLVIEHPDSYLRYRQHEISDRGDQLRDQIETPDGSVARLIERDGRPLTPDEDAAERDRLNYLLTTPSAFARHIKNEQANKKLGIDLLNLMPDAMLWSYAPGQPQPPNQLAGAASGAPPLVVLDFKPNPNWTPPNIPAEPLTGLEGRLWIDPRDHRMVHLEGDLFHAINIGWGMVVHIYPGGTVTVDQINLGGQRWIVDHIVEQISLRALMVKTVKQRLAFDSTNFQPVQPMPYQRAIKILLDTPLPTH